VVRGLRNGAWAIPHRRRETSGGGPGLRNENMVSLAVRPTTTDRLDGNILLHLPGDRCIASNPDVADVETEPFLATPPTDA
jgi:hypothetical protein